MIREAERFLPKMITRSIDYLREHHQQAIAGRDIILKKSLIHQSWRTEALAWQKLEEEKEKQPTIGHIRNFLYERLRSVNAEEQLNKLTKSEDPKLIERRKKLEIAQRLETPEGRCAAINEFRQKEDELIAELIADPDNDVTRDIIETRIEICDASIDVLKAVGFPGKSTRKASPQS